MEFPELERAASEFVRCMETNLDITGEATLRGRIEDGTAVFACSFFDPASLMNEKADSEEAQACEAAVDDVWMQWSDQQAELGNRDGYDTVAECLRTRGIAVESSDPAALSNVSDAHPLAYRECYDSAFGR